MINSITLNKLEDNLILHCLSTDLIHKKGLVVDLIHDGLDWDYLIISACKNRVIPLLYFNLNQISTEIVPNNYFNILHQYYNINARKNLILTSELIKIVTLLKSNNIKFISHKGPILAELAYKNLALRQYFGFEIIISQEDVQKTKKLLFSIGYKFKHIIETQKNFYIESLGKLVFINPKTNSQLVIRWNYLKNSFSSPNKIHDIWDIDNTKLVNVNGYEILTLNNECLILILSLECAKKQWSRLKYQYDIAELIKNNHIDWDKVMDLSEDFRVKRIVLLNLLLTRELFDIKFPNNIIQQINSDKLIKTLSFKLIKRFFYKKDSLIRRIDEKHEDAFLRFKLRESKVDGIKDFYQILTKRDKYRVEHHSLLHTSKLDKLFRRLSFFKKMFFLPHPIIIPIPYVKTPVEVVKQMLEIAKIGPNDIIYDLGCGDGRLIITAAKEYGVRGVGVDIDPKRIMESKDNAKKNGVEHLTTFLEQDILETDISKATLITIYLLPSVNRALKPMIQKNANPKTRILTREFSMGDWSPINIKIIYFNGRIIPVYLYET